jgi:hypothetical protein
VNVLTLFAVCLCKLLPLMILFNQTIFSLLQLSRTPVVTEPASCTGWVCSWHKTCMHACMDTVYTARLIRCCAVDGIEYVVTYHTRCQAGRSGAQHFLKPTADDFAQCCSRPVHPARPSARAQDPSGWATGPRMNASTQQGHARHAACTGQPQRVGGSKSPAHLVSGCGLEGLDHGACKLCRACMHACMHQPKSRAMDEKTHTPCTHPCTAALSQRAVSATAVYKF